MTFSIAARCARTGRYGLAVCSSSPAVAARCVFARAGVGAVSSQNITDPALGPRVLDLLADGATPEDALSTIYDTTDYIEYRQLSVVDSQGRSSAFSGTHTLGIHAQASAKNVVCAGNMLSAADIPATMLSIFKDSTEPDLIDRLLTAMQAAMDAGGEAGPVHSAGLLMVDKVSWPVADLRIDWHEDAAPITALHSLWRLYKPQMADYITRAKDPSAAPKYGVPGDP